MRPPILLERFPTCPTRYLSSTYMYDHVCILIVDDCRLQVLPLGEIEIQTEPCHPWICQRCILNIYTPMENRGKPQRKHSGFSASSSWDLHSQWGWCNTSIVGCHSIKDLQHTEDEFMGWQGGDDLGPWTMSTKKIPSLVTKEVPPQT